VAIVRDDVTYEWRGTLSWRREEEANSIIIITASEQQQQPPTLTTDAAIIERPWAANCRSRRRRISAINAPARLASPRASSYNI